MSFTPRKILVIASQQPNNQYSGGVSGIADSEQYWMRRLLDVVVAKLRPTGHDIRVGPLGGASSTFRTNVSWANLPENADADLLISLHSNATAAPDDHPHGIGVYHHPNSDRGRAFAEMALPFFKLAAAGGRAYIGTLLVDELAKTAPPALLIENEYHDHNDSYIGGADWLRDPANRNRLASAYLSFVVKAFGQKPAVEPPPPPANNDHTFSAGAYNAQLSWYGGTDYTLDANFLKDVFKVSLLFGAEMEAKARVEIGEACNYEYWANKTHVLYWRGDLFDFEGGESIELDFGPAGNRNHGAIGRVLKSKINGVDLAAVSVAVRANDAISGTDAQKLAGKHADIRVLIAKLAKYKRVVVGGDFATKDAVPLMKAAGYTLVTPYVDTMDKGGKVDFVFTRGLDNASLGEILATTASDHHGPRNRRLILRGHIDTN